MSEDTGGKDEANIITDREAWDFFINGPRDVFTCESCGTEAHRGNPPDLPGAFYAEVDNEPTIICDSCDEEYDWETVQARIRERRRATNLTPFGEAIARVRSAVRPLSTRLPIPISVHEVSPDRRPSLLVEQAVFVGRLGILLTFLLIALAGIAVFAAIAGALFVAPATGLEWLASTGTIYLDWGRSLGTNPASILLILGLGYLGHLVEYQRHLTDVEQDDGRTRPRWQYLAVVSAGGAVGWLAWVLSQLDVLGAILLPAGVVTWSAGTILLVYLLHQTLLEDRWSYGLRIHSALWKFPAQYTLGLMLYDGLIGLPGPESTALTVALLPPAIGTLYTARRALAFTERWGPISRQLRETIERMRLTVPWPWNSVRGRRKSPGSNQFGTLDDAHRKEADRPADAGSSLTREQELRQTREWASYLESELKDREEQMQDLEARLATVKQDLQQAREDDSSAGEQEDLLTDLFDIRDNFRRALDAEQLIEDDAAGQFREGIELIDSQIKSILEREGVEEIDTSGTADPEKHRVVKTVETNAYEPNEIVDVHQLGYRLDDRILREAHVVVATDPTDSAGGESDDMDRPTDGDDRTAQRGDSG